jgi:hypothetical protein
MVDYRRVPTLRFEMGADSLREVSPTGAVLGVIFDSVAQSRPLWATGPESGGGGSRPRICQAKFWG